MYFKPDYEFRWLVTRYRKSLQMRHWQGRETGWGEWADIPVVHDCELLTNKPDNPLTAPD